MAEPIVWGLLPKAQDDGTTIDEAITAAIAAHETDPEAHIGTDESIDVHRKNTTLDHPQASVLGDKISSNEVWYLLPFQNLDGVEHTSNVISVAGSGLSMEVTSGDPSANYAYVASSPSLKSDKDGLLQFPFFVDQDEPYEFKIGAAYDYTLAQGVYFKYVGGELTAVVDTPWGSYESDPIAWTYYNTSIFRIQYIAGERKFLFFVDSVEVGSYVDTGDPFSAFGFGFFVSAQYGGGFTPIYSVHTLFRSVGV